MKNKIILTGVDGRPSTKLAFSTMSSDSLLVHRRRRADGGEYYRVFRDREILADRIRIGARYLLEWVQDSLSIENTIAIRWGTREVLSANNHTVVYNRSDALQRATTKKRSREIFIENDIECPPFVSLSDNWRNSYRFSRYGRPIPIIARPNQHSKGRNFVLLYNWNDFRNHWALHSENWYYSGFIDKDREFRVHVAHGKVLALMEKMRPDNDNIAWNRAQNDLDPFTYIRWEEMDEQDLKLVLVAAIRAVEALGLDFGGVDVMLAEDPDFDGAWGSGNACSRITQIAYVLEVNTAPTLNTSPYVAKKYGMYFDWLFREETRRAHWENVIDRRHAKSMVFKNYQLRDEETN